MRLDPDHRAQAAAIAAELASIARSGRVLPGTISKRTMRCGRATCACRADPPRRHGPYFQWTRKVAAKTVGRWLAADQVGDYETWIDNDRKIRDLIARLEALGVCALEADPRTGKKR
ncbi:MAG: DUF6788 family protein [Acidimicrobiales bacterium]